MTVVGKSVWLHSQGDAEGRAWSSFRFFFKGKDVTADMLAHEPNWVELRKAAGQAVPPGM